MKYLTELNFFNDFCFEDGWMFFTIMLYFYFYIEDRHPSRCWNTTTSGHRYVLLTILCLTVWSKRQYKYWIPWLIIHKLNLWLKSQVQLDVHTKFETPMTIPCCVSMVEENKTKQLLVLIATLASARSWAESG